jgi:hypothetical protein
MAAKKRAGGAKKATGGKETTFAKGDHVAWSTSQGETHGVVERKLTTRTQIEGHEVAATRADPQYLVRSDKTGKTAARKPSALRRRGGD